MGQRVEVAQQVLTLTAEGKGTRSIARMLGIARNTVRRYRRVPILNDEPRGLSFEVLAHAVELHTGDCNMNASAVARRLREEGHNVSDRTVQRALRAHRLAAIANADENPSVKAPSSFPVAC